MKIPRFRACIISAMRYTGAVSTKKGRHLRQQVTAPESRSCRVAEIKMTESYGLTSTESSHATTTQESSGLHDDDL
jgi:hypothetical protein